MTDINPNTEYVDKINDNLIEVGVTVRCTLQLIDGGNSHEDVGFGKSQNSDKNVAYKDAMFLATQDSVKRVIKYFYSQ